MKTPVSLLRHSGLPRNVVRRKQPALQVEPKTAEELVQYRILLASSGNNRRQREHMFTVPLEIQADMNRLCVEPAYNKISEATRAKPLQVLLKVEKRVGNMYMLTIAESELMPEAKVTKQLEDLARQDAKLSKKVA